MVKGSREKPALPGPGCFGDGQGQEQPWLTMWEGTSLPKPENSPGQAARAPSSQAAGGTGRGGPKISNGAREWLSPAKYHPSEMINTLLGTEPG